MRNFILLLAILILSGCGESTTKKVKHISVKKAETPPTEVTKQKKTSAKKASSSSKTTAVPKKSTVKKVETKKLTPKEVYLAKKAAWNKACQKKADEYGAQLVALRKKATQLNTQVINQKKQISALQTKLYDLEAAAKKKTRYYYYVHGGKRTTNPILHPGRPPARHSGTVKYVMKPNQAAVNAYNNAQTQYDSLKKKYYTGRKELITLKNQIVALSAAQKRYLAKIKK